MAALGIVRSAYLTASDEDGGRAVLSLSVVGVEYVATAEWLDEQIPLHNRQAAEMAGRQSWTVYRFWERTTLAGLLAMRSAYEVPGKEEEEPAGQIQGLVAYGPEWTLQLLLGVYPPGALDRNRAVMDTVVATFELLPAGR